MRKEWMEPVIEVQEFVANEYVAACESGMVYKFECDAPRACLKIKNCTKHMFLCPFS